MAQHAQQVQGVGVFLLLRQDLLIQLGGRSQLAGTVHFDRGRQCVLHVSTRGIERDVLPEKATGLRNSLIWSGAGA